MLSSFAHAYLSYVRIHIHTQATAPLAFVSYTTPSILHTTSHIVHLCSTKSVWQPTFIFLFVFVRLHYILTYVPSAYLLYIPSSTHCAYALIFPWASCGW